MSSGFASDSFAAQRIATGLQEAERFRRAGRPSDSERICRELLRASPNAASVLNYLALLLRDRGELDAAKEMFVRAIAQAPRDAPLHNNLGNLERKRGDLASAESSLRKALALQPVYPEAHYNLGIVLGELNRSDEALPHFRRAVEQRPNYVEALTQIGVAASAMSDGVEALRMFDTAIKFNPRYFDARYYRGMALAALGRLDEAIAELRTALALAPTNANAHYALANALEQAARESEALEEFALAVEYGPTLVDAHRRLNALAWQMGRNDIGMMSYARARARVGYQPDLLLAEADQRLMLGQAAVSEDLLRRAREVASPDEPAYEEVTALLARALTSQKKYDESIVLLESVIRDEPNLLSRHRSLAATLLRAGRAEEAVALTERGLKLDPHDQMLLAFRLLAFRETGDSRLDALADLERFVGVYDLAPPPGYASVEAFNRALAEELALLHTRNVEPLDQTLRGGTQTPGYLFDRPGKAVEGLRGRIREAVADYVRALPDDPAHPLLARKDSEFDFSGAWSCRLRSSGFHSNHVHPEGWISSAYYVALPDAVADETARQGWLKFGESNIALGERDRVERAVKPSVGRLVLFPSYFWHGTVPFASQDTRLTVAFDVVPGKLKGPRTASGY
jgi:tetratricopeptide (TPR) repeat protein